MLDMSLVTSQLSSSSAITGFIAPVVSIVSLYIMLLLPHLDEAKRGRFKQPLRVGTKNKEPGRYTEYSQVLVPATGKYRTEEGNSYYRHPKGAKITKSSHFDYEFQLGHKIVFICVASGKPRPKIVWFKDGKELFDHHYLHISEWYRGKRRLKSKMEIDPATQGDAGIYECHANNKWSVDMRSFRTDYDISFD